MTHPSRRPIAVLAPAVLTLALLAPAPARARPLPSEDGWNTDVRQAMAGGQRYLDRRADRGADPGKRLAINLDIDNTSLATHYDAGTATPRVLRFATKADNLGMAVLFNTARPRSDMRRTAGVLRRAGYTVTRMCGRKRGEEVVHSKKRCRRVFRDACYTLVANVGNRSTDLEGRGYEKGYKLPSYGGRLS